MTNSTRETTMPFPSRLASPSARVRGPSHPQRRTMDAPPDQSIAIVDRIRRAAIAVHDGETSLYDVILVERPAWIEDGHVRATLFSDGRPWSGSVDLLSDLRAAEVEEMRRIGAGAAGIYEGHGVVVDVFFR